MIRIARPQDENAVRLCAEDAYAQYIPAIGKKPAPMIADFSAQIARGEIFVIESSASEIDGFIVFFPRNGVMFLENLAVCPRAAGTGLGKTLIKFCETEAIKMGLDTVELYTNEQMIENLSLYPHLGYTETERRTENGFNRVYFRKLLV